jgi:hypothetical protein
VLTFPRLATQTFPSVPAQHHVLEVPVFRAADAHRRPQAASASVHATARMHERSNERTPFHAPLRRTLSCTVAAHVSSPHHPTIQDPLSITAVLCYRYENEWVGWGPRGDMLQRPHWRRHGSTVGSRCFWAKGESCCMCAYADVCGCHGGESSRVLRQRAGPKRRLVAYG